MCNIEGCNNSFIENKKRNLCPFHNWLRLNPDKTENDYYNRYNSTSNKSIKPIKQFSKKNAAAYLRKKKTYDEIDLQREQLCEGCGSSNHLSRSHILSVNNRKDLEDDINNIRLYCMCRPDGSKGCHSRWEGNLEQKKTLLDFEKNMAYVKEKDLQAYNLILLK